MRVLHSYDEAFQIGMECLEYYKKASKPALGGISRLPTEVYGPWSMTKDALSNTLKYVYDLSHACYLICIINFTPKVYKIQATTIPNVYRKTFKRNKLISKKKTFRLMQCVLRPFKSVESTSKELEVFLEKISVPLPNGVFLLSATDSMILRKDKTAPWHMVSNNEEITTYSSYIPILAYSGHKEFLDIPVPNFDDILYAIGKSIPSLYVDWETKKDIAVFRGTSTGCGYTSDTNMRLKLSKMRSDILDVGITTHTNQKRFDPIHGIGSVNKREYPVVPLMPMSEQAKHKYIIHIDGNVAAYRLLTTMLTGSLILKVEGDYTLWVDHLLKNGKHYVSVKSDLSNLEEVIEWCKKHDKKCKKIAMNGYEFAKQALTKSYIDASFAKVLWSVV